MESRPSPRAAAYTHFPTMRRTGFPSDGTVKPQRTDHHPILRGSQPQHRFEHIQRGRVLAAQEDAADKRSDRACRQQREHNGRSLVHQEPATATELPASKTTAAMDILTRPVFFVPALWRYPRPTKGC
jgi:hypothetical protein